ncbi:DUF4167 domain-containing protein [Acidiphilium acidophilum]|uniref:DUF4167 domain-containing protein n=1 Tax=Acidiphilium acidophilum TaxID=76588 RepID=UPI002E8E64DE|nr:DUF4167 domain-containing protein [Acidiphilium acidophilum]
MNIKRMRGRNNRHGGGGGGGGGGGNFRSFQSGTPLNRNHVFDSSGPEQRVRGTAQQLYDKYQQMGRDASSSGDRVLAEAYYQYAEHYFRIISAMNQAQGNHQGGYQGQQTQGGQNGGGQNGGQNGGGSSRRDEGGDEGDAANGLGEQPGIDAREIPINVAPPEG